MQYDIPCQAWQDNGPVWLVSFVADWSDSAAQIPPDPFEARMFFSRPVLTTVKSSSLRRKTDQLLRTGLYRVGRVVGINRSKFDEVCTAFYSFLLSSSWTNWYFKHLWKCMAWIVKSRRPQEILTFCRKSFDEWFYKVI